MKEGNEPIYKYQPLWGGWKVDGFIGKGSFGSVYKVSKEDLGYKYISAVKIITVPSDEQYREARASIDDDERTLSGYFQDIVSSIIKEINLLYELRGNSNIISYEDHLVIKREDEIGWDILIRMEHATSFTKYITEHQLTLEQVIQLGIDVCSALCTCEKAGIIHRDIKDENIFVSDKGMFKLGDFGIAKELSKSGRAASRMGTPFFMAPEVFRGDKYNKTADIYSLGIVMYKLLNYSRMPFMPAYPAEIRYRDSEAALDKRMSGEPLPPFVKDYGKLSSIILKACSFNPDDRYSSAMLLKKELEAVLEGTGETEKSKLVTLIKGKEDRLGSANSSGSKKSLNPSPAGPEGIVNPLNVPEDIPLAKNNDDVEELAGNETISIAGMAMPVINSENADNADDMSEECDDILDKTVSIFGNSPSKDRSAVQKSVGGEAASTDAKQGIGKTEATGSENEEAAKQGSSQKNEDIKSTPVFKNSKLLLGIACVLIAVAIMAFSVDRFNKKQGLALDTSLPVSTENSTEESSPATTIELTQTDADIAGTAQNPATVQSQSATTVQPETKPEEPAEIQTSVAETSTADTKKDDIKPQTQENSTTKNTTTSTKRNRTSTVKTPPKPTANQNNTAQTPTTTESVVSISDFKLYVTYGDKYTFTVTSPKNDQKYTYIFKAKENKGEDLGVISVTRTGPDTFSWDPPKEDTYYYITLQVKGISGQTTGVSK